MSSWQPIAENLQTLMKRASLKRKKKRLNGSGVTHGNPKGLSKKIVQTAPCAGMTGFEPAISALTGQRVKPLHYTPGR